MSIRGSRQGASAVHASQADHFRVSPASGAVETAAVHSRGKALEEDMGSRRRGSNQQAGAGRRYHMALSRPGS